MSLDYKQGEEKLLDFYYSPLFSKVTDKIHYVCKSNTDQIRFTNKFLGDICKGKLDPKNVKTTLENSQLFDSSQITIILSILNTDILDPLKDALDAVYNNPAPQNTAILQGQPAVSGTVPIVHSVPKSFEIPQARPKQSPESNGDIDPLDIFDRAKSDVMVTTQKETIAKKENVLEVESAQDKTIPEDKEIDTSVMATESVNDSTAISNSSIRINKAAVLGNEENSNLLALQNSQAITQLSRALKNNTPIIEKEDLSLYVQSKELKEEPPRPLDPIALTEEDYNIDTAEDAEVKETTAMPLDRIPTVISAPLDKVDAQVAEPKKSSISENIAQSHLKFIQNDKQRIPENKSYSKLLDAMTQKPKNQPPVLEALRDTFAHPDKHSEPSEVSRPKPKKYTLTKEDSIRSAVISSTESSSNTKSNAIMEEVVENDIINLAKDISQQRKPTSAENVDISRKPIIYNKQPLQKEDPFESINENRLKEKKETKNSNIIDLS